MRTVEVGTHLLKASAFALTLAVFIFIFIIYKTGTYREVDFPAFYSAGRILTSGNSANLYSTSFQKQYQYSLINIDKGVVIFRNTPTAALLFVPISKLTYEWAYWFVFLFNYVLVLVLIYLISGVLKNVPALLIYVVSLGFIPVINTLGVGQISILISLVIALAILRVIRKDYFTAGILTSIFFLKPHFLILIPLLVVSLKNKLSYIKGVVLGLFVLASNSFLIIPTFSPISYIRFVFETEDQVFRQISWIGALSALNYEGIKTFTFVLGTVSYLLICLYLQRLSKTMSPLKAVSIALLSGVGLLPHLWEYDLVLILFPLVYLISIFQNTRVKPQKLKTIVMFVMIFAGYFWRVANVPFMYSLTIFLTALFWLANPKIDNKKTAV